MHISLPSGASWNLHGIAKKLDLRAELPGARLFDLAAQSLRAAKELGVTAADRFALALPSSWLVNSPATSPALRRWALSPHRETCLALIELFESDPAEWAHDPRATEAIVLGLRSLGSEPYVAEALSKALALLVPEAVPLMSRRARAFVLGPTAKDEPDAFARITSWFRLAVRDHEAELEASAREHEPVHLVPGAVLDRVLWFDAEGHVHFPNAE